MDYDRVQLPPREAEVAELLLRGYDNLDIAQELHMARRTVKAHFNRMFIRFDIKDGVKRVKLAVILYKRQLCTSRTMDLDLPVETEANDLPSKSLELSPLLPMDARTEKWPTPSELPSTSSRTFSEQSTISLGCGTVSNSHSGM